MKSHLKAAFLGLVLTGLCGVSAHAQDGTIFGYKLNIAVRGWITPTYDGSRRVAPAPGGSLAVSKPADFDAYAAPDDAASFSVISTKRVVIGAAASFREARLNNDELMGMRSIGWSLQGGGFANVWPTPWLRLHVEALKGLTAQYGIQVNTSADAITQQGRWRLAAGPRFGWADATFNTRYFGVTRAEAIASPYIDNPYTVGAGAHFVGLEGAAEYKWSPKIRLTLDTRYHRLLGDDANSPLVRQLGRRDQFSVSTGIRFMIPN